MPFLSTLSTLAVDSPPSSPAAAGAKPARGAGMCPNVLRREGCPCTNPAKHLPTPESKLTHLLGRALKAWARATSRTLPRRLVALTELVARVLAERGAPLAHVAVACIDAGGAQGPPGAAARRQLWSMTFMLPDEPGALTPAAHRPVAEIVACVADDVLGDATARFEADWADWHVLVRGKYFADGGAPARIPMPEQAWATGQMALGAIYVELAEVFASAPAAYDELAELSAGAPAAEAGAGPVEVPAKEFVLTMGAAARVVKEAGADVCAFDIQAVWRVRRGRVDLAARIALLTSAEPDAVVGAVVLAEPRAPAGGTPEVGFVVVLNEEWPIAHVYRNKLPAPNVVGLAKLLQE